MLLSASGGPRILTLFGMSAGTAVAVMNYISQIFSPVESLGMEIQTIQSAMAGIHRIQEFLELPEKERPETGASDSPAFTENGGRAAADAPIVEFRDVSFAYEDGKPVLKHLNLTVEAGDQLTLLGRTERKKYALQAAPGSLPAHLRTGPDSRRPGGLHSGSETPEALRLRGAVLPHGSRNRAGTRLRCSIRPFPTKPSEKRQS